MDEKPGRLTHPVGSWLVGSSMTEVPKSSQPAMPLVSLKRVAAPVRELGQCPAELTASCHLPASLDKSTDKIEAQFQPNSKEQMPRMPAAAPPEECSATAGPPAAYLSLDSLSKILPSLLIVAGPSRMRRRKL